MIVGLYEACLFQKNPRIRWNEQAQLKFFLKFGEIECRIKEGTGTLSNTFSLNYPVVVMVSSGYP